MNRRKTRKADRDRIRQLEAELLDERHPVPQPQRLPRATVKERIFVLGAVITAVGLVGSIVVGSVIAPSQSAASHPVGRYFVAMLFGPLALTVVAFVVTLLIGAVTVVVKGRWPSWMDD